MAVASKLQAQKTAATKAATTTKTTTATPKAAPTTTPAAKAAPTTKTTTNTKTVAKTTAAPAEEKAKPRSFKAYLSQAKGRLKKAEQKVADFETKEAKKVDLLKQLQEAGSKLTKGQQSTIDKYNENLRKLQIDVNAAKKEIAVLEPKAKAEAEEAAKSRQLARLQETADIVEWEERALTSKESKELERIETRMKTVQREVQEGMIEFANLLKEVKDKKLWVNYPGGFDEYCEDKWGMHRSNVNRQINVAKVFENLEGTKIKGLITAGEEGEALESTPKFSRDKLPKNEGQVRELTRAGEDKETQVAVWQAVVDESEQFGKPITAALIREVVDKKIASGEIAKGLDATSPAKKKEPAGPLDPKKWVTFQQQTYKGVKYTIMSHVHEDKAGSKTYTFSVFIDGKQYKDEDTDKVKYFGSHPNALEFCQKLAKAQDAENDEEFEEAEKAAPAKPAKKTKAAPPPPPVEEEEEDDTEEDEDDTAADSDDEEDEEEGADDDEEFEDEEEEDESDEESDDSDEDEDDDEEDSEDDDSDDEDEDEDEDDESDDDEEDEEDETEDDDEEVERIPASSDNWLS